MSEILEIRDQDFDIPEGFEIKSFNKKEWIVGDYIETGGYANVYLGARKDEPSEYEYAIKIARTDGNLLEERKFYHEVIKSTYELKGIQERRKHYNDNANQTWLDFFKNLLGSLKIGLWYLLYGPPTKEVEHLGIPKYHGYGEFEYEKVKFDFIVLERCGKDLNQMMAGSGIGNTLPLETIYSVGLCMLDILECIHGIGYVHSDVKDGNIMFGYKPGTENQVYLIDMGLAAKYTSDGKHFKEKYNHQYRHTGTTAFSSRDFHNGCFSRRGDLETLCYNMLCWMSGKLPWERYKKDTNRNLKRIEKAKYRCMEDVERFFDFLFKKEICPDAIKELFQYVSKLKFEDKPDYNFCRKILRVGLKKLGFENCRPLNFKSAYKKITPTSHEKRAAIENSLPNNIQVSNQEKLENDGPVIDQSDIPTSASTDASREKKVANGNIPTKNNKFHNHKKRKTDDSSVMHQCDIPISTSVSSEKYATSLESSTKNNQSCNQNMRKSDDPAAVDLCDIPTSKNIYAFQNKQSANGESLPKNIQICNKKQKSGIPTSASTNASSKKQSAKKVILTENNKICNQKKKKSVDSIVMDQCNIPISTSSEKQAANEKSQTKDIQISNQENRKSDFRTFIDFCLISASTGTDVSSEKQAANEENTTKNSQLCNQKKRKSEGLSVIDLHDIPASTNQSNCQRRNPRRKAKSRCNLALIKVKAGRKGTLNKEK